MEKCGKMCENVEKCAGDPFSIYYLGSLANESAISSDVAHSGKENLQSVSTYSVVKACSLHSKTKTNWQLWAGLKK